MLVCLFHLLVHKTKTHNIAASLTLNALSLFSLQQSSQQSSENSASPFHSHSLFIHSFIQFVWQKHENTHKNSAVKNYESTQKRDFFLLSNYFQLSNLRKRIQLQRKKTQHYYNTVVNVIACHSYFFRMVAEIHKLIIFVLLVLLHMNCKDHVEISFLSLIRTI